MSDPREIRNSDPYAELSDDEEDIENVKRRLKELEREKIDLEHRLSELERRRKLRDPNFDYTEVTASPVKKASIPDQIKREGYEVPLSIKEPENNINEEFLKQRAGAANSTSYFVQKLQSAKKTEHQTLAKKSELLAHRVYTFDGKTTKDFQPIDVNELEELSGMNIDRRYIPSKVLRDATKNVKILRLSKLFSKVKAPDFDEPEYANWLVIAVISKKTEPRMTNAVKPIKFFTLSVTDFTFDINILFFGKELVEKYYKLRVGDLIAVLNPEIMPWKKSERSEKIGASISFSLKISKDTNNILEVAHSKDLGFCQYFIKNKGKNCEVAVNKSKEQYCEYHREIKMRQSSSKRVELSSSVTMRAPVFNDRQQTIVRDQRKGGKTQIKYVSLPDRNEKRERTAAETNRFLFTTSTASTAFFDDDFQNPDILANLDNKRRKIQESKDNRKLERKLKDIEKRMTSNPSAITDDDDKKSATLSMFQHGILRNIGFDPTKGKASLAILSRDKEKMKQSEKGTAIADLQSFRKDNVILKPTKMQIKKKFEKRNDVYNKIMVDNHVSHDQSDENSSDDLEIV